MRYYNKNLSDEEIKKIAEDIISLRDFFTELEKEFRKMIEHEMPLS